MKGHNGERSENCPAQQDTPQRTEQQEKSGNYSFARFVDPTAGTVAEQEMMDVKEQNCERSGHVILKGQERGDTGRANRTVNIWEAAK